MNLTELGVIANAAALIGGVLAFIHKNGRLEGTVAQIDKRLDRIERSMNGLCMGGFDNEDQN